MQTMTDDGSQQRGNEPQKASASMEHKHKIRPSDTRISKALNDMHGAWESGVWRRDTDACMMAVLSFITAVPPDALLDHEHEFVHAFGAALAEAQEFDAKGGIE